MNELHSLLSDHGEARGRTVPSSQAPQLIVTSPEASTSLNQFCNGI